MTVYDMGLYRLRIAQTSEHAPPVAEVYTECTAAGCEERYLMPPPRARLADFEPGWLDEHRPRFDNIIFFAARRRWTYSDEHGPRCPAHPWGTPVGELEPIGAAHRRAQAYTDTAALPVEEIRAELAGQEASSDA